MNTVWIMEERVGTKWNYLLCYKDPDPSKDATIHYILRGWASMLNDDRRVRRATADDLADMKRRVEARDKHRRDQGR